MDKNLSEQDFYNILWSYFSQHANQRIQLVNFYIIIETFLFTGLLTVLNLDVNYSLIGILISIAAIFFSWIFYNLDVRTKILIKNCENAIKKIEQKYQKDFGEEIMIFSVEEKNTAELRKNFSFPWSYAKSFKYIFLFFSIMGIVSFVCSICLFVCG